LGFPVLYTIIDLRNWQVIFISQALNHSLFLHLFSNLLDRLGPIIITFFDVLYLVTEHTKLFIYFNNPSSFSFGGDSNFFSGSEILKPDTVDYFFTI